MNDFQNRIQEDKVQKNHLQERKVQRKILGDYVSESAMRSETIMVKEKKIIATNTYTNASTQ